MKRLITFILVLIMLASMLALPAMASEVEPRYVVVHCPCGGLAEYYGIVNGSAAYRCDTCYKIFVP